VCTELWQGSLVERYPFGDVSIIGMIKLMPLKGLGCDDTGLNSLSTENILYC
jgi:hypothetical protein